MKTINKGTRVLNRGFEVVDSKLEIVEDYLESIDSEDLKDFMPQRATNKSAGYDIRSVESVIINPGECKIVKTGVCAYMNPDEELQIRPRSGISYKSRVMIVNSPGTIDSDYYPQEIGIIMLNLSDVPFNIEIGDRIAQGVFSKYLTIDDENIKNQERTGGFGSTGVEK